MRTALTARWTICIAVGLMAATPAFGQRLLRSGDYSRSGKSTSNRSTDRHAPVRKASVRTTDQTTDDSTAKQATTAGDGLAWQTALDRAGFSPGVIDGYFGRKAAIALKAFQQHAGLPVTAKQDDATAAALGVTKESKTRTYTITADDLAQVKPAPKGWIERSKVTLLGFESTTAMLAERGHCTKRLATALNPRINLAKINIGDTVTLPNVGIDMGTTKAAAIEIDFQNKLIRAVDNTGKPIGLFHCSIAANKMKRPAGTSKIERVAENPTYLFDPENWPEVKGVKERLVIPPGPRSPVGVCWIGLTQQGYGIHGTPEPEMVGKSGSHGCFRVTNWDAQRLAKMVEIGKTDVRFTDRSVSTSDNSIIRSAGLVEDVP